MQTRIQRRINDEPGRTATLGVVGKIKVGEKVATANGGERPTSLDYFRVDCPNKEHEKLFYGACGERPTRLTITFLSNDVGECCQQFYELRDKSGGRIARGDGRTFQLAQNVSGVVADVTITPDDPQAWMNEQQQKAAKDYRTPADCKWKETLILRFVIPTVPVIALWEFRTNAEKSTIPQILGVIDSTFDLAGRIKMIPFDLTVRKVKSDKSGAKNLYPVVSLTCNISPESAEQVRSLPAGVHMMLNESRISALSSGASVGTYDPEIDQEAEYEDVTATKTDVQYCEDFFRDRELITLEQFNEAVKAIRGMKPAPALGKLLAETLGDKAQVYGFLYDKISLSYIKPA